MLRVLIISTLLGGCATQDMPHVAFEPDPNVRSWTWPERSEGAYPAPKRQEDSSILYQRFEGASRVRLGTWPDLAAIQKTLREHMRPRRPEATEIRWLSPDLVIVSTGWWEGTLAAARYFYVIERKDGAWVVSHYYMMAIS